MSADRWGECPRCKARQLDKVAAEKERVSALYGIVPVEEFDRERKALRELEAQATRDNRREDYEMSMDSDGVFTASFSTHCSDCDWGWSFEHRVEVPVTP